MQTKLMKLIQ